LKRLFTFGCSFTNYKWPTWADILAKDFDHYENWAQEGGGNHFIFNSLNEAIVRNNISKDDTVIIMWTSIIREDRYVNGRWIARGSIYNQSKDFYDDHFIKNCTDNRGYLLRDLAFIHAAGKMLDQLGVNYVFLSMIPLSNVDDYTKTNADNVDDVLKLYKETIDVIKPSIYEVVFNFNWFSREFLPSDAHVKQEYKKLAGAEWPVYEEFVKKLFNGIKKSIVDEIEKYDLHNKLYRSNRGDSHPTPIEHLEYIDQVLPNFVVSDLTRRWVKEIDRKLRQGLPFNDMWTKHQPERF
jgi:hypothetical protein